MSHPTLSCSPVRALLLAGALTTPLSACTPTPFEMAYSAGVATAARDDDTVVLRDPQADLGLELAVSRVWLDVSRTRFARLDADANAGTVLVTGEVRSAADHIEALRLVWSLPKVRAVRADIEIASGEALNMDLASTIAGRLSEDPAVHAAGFSIEVVDDSVYVLGRAANQAELNRVIRHARAAGNVRRVVTLVQIGRSGA
jgi:osmotically-inducible protein OsmY